MDSMDALGMIETRGLTALIEAADAMVKAARVQLVGYQQIGGGLRHRPGARRRGRLQGRHRRRSRSGQARGRVIAVHVIPAPRRAGRHLPPQRRNNREPEGATRHVSTERRQGRSSIDPAVRQAGVVGEGGAGFPAHVKYAASVDTVIANGCECEPLLYTDQHLMRPRPDIVRALSARDGGRGSRARRGGHQGQVPAMCRGRPSPRPCAKAGLELARLDNFYPAGDEHILVHEVTGRTIPPLGLPKAVDALVANVGTLVSVARAMDGVPVTRKVVTVTGEVARPAVLEAPIGTPLAE